MRTLSRIFIFLYGLLGFSVFIFAPLPKTKKRKAFSDPDHNKKKVKISPTFTIEDLPNELKGLIFSYVIEDQFPQNRFKIREKLQLVSKGFKHVILNNTLKNNEYYIHLAPYNKLKVAVLEINVALVKKFYAALSRTKKPIDIFYTWDKFGKNLCDYIYESGSPEIKEFLLPKCPSVMINFPKAEAKRPTTQYFRYDQFVKEVSPKRCVFRTTKKPKDSRLSRVDTYTFSPTYTLDIYRGNGRMENHEGSIGGQMYEKCKQSFKIYAKRYGLKKVPIKQ